MALPIGGLKENPIHLINQHLRLQQFCCHSRHTHIHRMEGVKEGEGGRYGDRGRGRGRAREEGIETKRGRERERGRDYAARWTNMSL